MQCEICECSISVVDWKFKIAKNVQVPHTTPIVNSLPTVIVPAL